MLRIERIFEPAAIQDERDTYNALIPNGSNLKATMLIEFPDEAQRRSELARLGGIEHKVYAEIEGLGRAFAIADEDMDRSNTEKTSAVHFLRLEFRGPQTAALLHRADFGLCPDDERLRVVRTSEG